MLPSEHHLPCSLPRTNTQEKELHFRFALNGVIAVTLGVFPPLANFNCRSLLFRARHFTRANRDRRGQTLAHFVRIKDFT
jgi:hypothetical protein